MTRIDKTFGALRSGGRKGFVAYIMAGDPDVARMKDSADLPISAASECFGPSPLSRHSLCAQSPGMLELKRFGQCGNCPKVGL
jgi:hypothetical protein